MSRYINIGNERVLQCNEFTPAKEFVYAGEYTTCLGEARGDYIGWKYANIILQWDSLPQAQLDGVEWIPTVTSKKVKKKTKKKYKSGKKKGQYKYKKVWINRPTLYGKRLIITKVGSSIVESTKRPGTTVRIEPMVYGRCYQGNSFIFPNYSMLFKRNNIAGSFTHKGNPKWQPRDVFIFHRLDGSTEICTLENITFVHEGGGMLAQATYRKGIC